MKLFPAVLLIPVLAVAVSCSEKKQDTAGPANQSPAESASPAAAFGPHLVQLNGGQLKPFDAAALKDVKYYAFYYSASWCPPCRAFTPTLVSFYNEFKAKHPDFELIFVNHDQNADDMLAYMKGDAMTWPAVRFDDIDGTKANQYCGEGIPDLVLVDAGGKVLADSFNGSEYRGPQAVIDDIKRIVP